MKPVCWYEKIRRKKVPLFFWDILFIMVWKSSIPQLISNLCAIDLSARRKLRTRSTSSKSHSNYKSPKTNPHKCIEHTQLTQELVEN